MNDINETTPSGNADPQPGLSPRRPIFAALMSLVLPGFGQLYNGQPNLAVWLFMSFSLVAVPGIASIALYAPTAMIGPVLGLGLCVEIGIWIYSVFHAWSGARSRIGYVLRPWQTSGLYVSVFVVCNLLILPIAISWVAKNQVRAFRIPSASMMPALQPGDHLFADMGYNCPYCWSEVARGDIAIFIYPDNRNHYYVKRVLGLPGDRIQLVDHRLFVNGQALSETGPGPANEPTREFWKDKSWMVQWDGTPSSDLDITVSPGHVYVLGDNRGKSNDSRKFGQVPLRDIVGRARQIWMSYGKNGVRWRRIGLPL